MKKKKQQLWGNPKKMDKNKNKNNQKNKSCFLVMANEDKSEHTSEQANTKNTAKVPPRESKRQRGGGGRKLEGEVGREAKAGRERKREGEGE